MITISIYLKTTGQIVRTSTCPDDLLDLQYNKEIENYITGNYPGNIFYIENNVPTVIPAAPNNYSQFDYTTKQWIDPRTAETQWRIIKAQRNKLLSDSDWTQLPDVPLTTKAAWATYRQQLRDVTTQTDPFNITWPQAPQQ